MSTTDDIAGYSVDWRVIQRRAEAAQLSAEIISLALARAAAVPEPASMFFAADAAVMGAVALGSRVIASQAQKKADELEQRAKQEEADRKAAEEKSQQEEAAQQLKKDIEYSIKQREVERGSKEFIEKFHRDLGEGKYDDRKSREIERFAAGIRDA